MSRLVSNAIKVATRAHRNQTRKFTGASYIDHPKAVVEILKQFHITDPETIAAAWLHDVVEDCEVSLEEIGKHFGPVVMMLVENLTDVSTAHDGTRAMRKAKDREHTALADPRAKNIKLADLLDNTRDIAAHHPAFALVYIPEKLALLEVLKEGTDPRLFRAAYTAVMTAARQLRLAS